MLLSLKLGVGPDEGLGTAGDNGGIKVLLIKVSQFIVSETLACNEVYMEKSELKYFASNHVYPTFEGLKQKI